jgi:hypothetical protein
MTNTRTDIHASVGFELKIPVFERANTVHALDGAATVVTFNPILFFVGHLTTISIASLMAGRITIWKLFGRKRTWLYSSTVPEIPRR